MIKSANQVLLPLSCVVREEALGQYEIEMTHPLDFRVRDMTVGLPIVLPVPVPYWPSAPEADTFDQTFRVYSTEIDTAAQVMTIRARHVSYDAAGVVLGAGANFTRKLISEVIAGISAAVIGTTTITLTSPLVKRVTADYRYRNLLEAVLDPDVGLARLTRAKVIRDNEAIYIGPNDTVDRGVSIRYGKNLLGVRFVTDTDGVVTRIIPLGKDAQGNTLLLPEKYVQSARVNDYPKPLSVTLEVPDAQVKTDAENPGDNMTLEQVYAALRDAAAAEYEAGADLPAIQMDVVFLAIGDTVEYAQYRNLEKVRLYNTVKVVDTFHGFEVTAQVTGYEWDCLAGRYVKVSVGNVYGVKLAGIGAWQLPNGGVPGFKLVPQSVGGDRIVNGSVGSLQIGNAVIGVAHIGAGTFDELSGRAITAVKAEFERVVAGEITADQFWTSVAHITRGEIGAASIDYSQIKDLAAGTAVIREGTAGRLLIDRLDVSEGNFVNLSAGNLIVQGTSGALYQITVDAEGNVITQLRQISNDDVADVSLNAGEKLIHGSITAELLNVQQIFASEAMIDAIRAHNIEAQAIGVNHLNPQVYEVAAKNATGQQIVVELSNGAILDAENTMTVATLRVYHQGVDVTDRVPASLVYWERISQDTAGDAAFNADPAHQGTKAVTINAADVDFRGVLRCRMNETQQYAVPRLEDGRLILEGGDAQLFSRDAGGHLHYGGDLNYSAVGGSLMVDMVVGAFRIDVQLSNLKTSYLSITRKGLELYGSGFVKIGSGGHMFIESSGNLVASSGGSFDLTAEAFTITDRSSGVKMLEVSDDGLDVNAGSVNVNNGLAAGSIESASIYGNVVNTFKGTYPWKGSFAATFGENGLPKYLKADVNVVVPAGVYNENVVIQGFFGARLTVTLPAGTTINGSLTVKHCSAVSIIGADNATCVIRPKTGGPNTQCLAVYQVVYFVIQQVRLTGYAGRTTGTNGTAYGAHFQAGAFYMYQCQIDRVTHAVYAERGANGYVYGCKGGVPGGSDPATLANIGNSIFAHSAATIGVVLSVPASANGMVTAVATILSTASEDSSAGELPAAQTDRSYAASGYGRMKKVERRTGWSFGVGGAKTWGSYADYPALSTNWSPGPPRQGVLTLAAAITAIQMEYYSWKQDRELNYGMWLFPAIDTAGGTIKTAKLTIQRSSSQGTPSATATLFGHAYTTLPTRTTLPATTAYAQSVTLAMGEEVTITLSASMVAGLNAGTVKGFALKGVGALLQMSGAASMELTY